MATFGFMTMNENEYAALETALLANGFYAGASRHGLMSAEVQDFSSDEHFVRVVYTGISGNLVVALNAFENFTGPSAEVLETLVLFGCAGAVPSAAPPIGREPDSGGKGLARGVTVVVSKATYLENGLVRAESPEGSVATWNEKVLIKADRFHESTIYSNRGYSHGFAMAAGLKEVSAGCFDKVIELPSDAIRDSASDGLFLSYGAALRMNAADIIDMEAFGFLKAVPHTRLARCIVLRVITDFLHDHATEAAPDVDQQQLLTEAACEMLPALIRYSEDPLVVPVSGPPSTPSGDSPVLDVIAAQRDGMESSDASSEHLARAMCADLNALLADADVSRSLVSTYGLSSTDIAHLREGLSSYLGVGYGSTSLPPLIRRIIGLPGDQQVEVHALRKIDGLESGFNLLVTELDPRSKRVKSVRRFLDRYFNRNGTGKPILTAGRNGSLVSLSLASPGEIDSGRSVDVFIGTRAELSNKPALAKRTAGTPEADVPTSSQPLVWRGFDDDERLVKEVSQRLKVSQSRRAQLAE